MSKIDELLKVLNMPEEEQDRWAFENLPAYRNGDLSLADLAFRLRNKSIELKNEFLVKSLSLVYAKCSDKVVDGSDCLIWWMYNSKPIHWIIAALIAEQLGEQDGKET